VIVPIPGTSRVDHLEPSVAAAGIELTEEEFRAIDTATAGA
jgi:aryl-alcohol dehydrogenase-like predicted oxidoreductase